MSWPRRNVLWRWSLLAALLVGLTSLPALARHLPSPATSREPAARLLAAVQASSRVAFSGYAESHGSLAVPDLPQLGELPGLLGGTTKMRVWWDGPSQWRVDKINDVGEADTYAFPGGSWLWDSERRRATELDGQPPVRVPRPADLLPTELGLSLIHI